MASFISIYINEVSNIITKYITTVFVDETSVVIIIPKDIGSLSEEVNLHLGAFDKWFNNNSLMLNVCKTHLVQFCASAALGRSFTYEVLVRMAN